MSGVGASSGIPADDGPLRHLVLLRLQDGITAGSADRLEAALRELVEDAGPASRGWVHRDLGLRPGMRRAATWAAQIDFAGPADFNAYLASSQHHNFLREHGPSIDWLCAAQIPLTQ